MKTSEIKSASLTIRINVRASGIDTNIINFDVASCGVAVASLEGRIVGSSEHSHIRTTCAID